MKDITDRLREHGYRVSFDAVAEIERLQIAAALRGTEHRRDMEYCNTEIARLRAALEFYADYNTYCGESPFPAESDFGERARTALNGGHQQLASEKQK